MPNHERPETLESTRTVPLAGTMLKLSDRELLELYRQINKREIMPKPTDTKTHKQSAETRIAQEAEQLHNHLSATARLAVLIIPDPTEMLFRRINNNGDAWAVYNKLSEIDRDKIIMSIGVDKHGSPTYKLNEKLLTSIQFESTDLPFPLILTAKPACLIQGLLNRHPKSRY